METDTISKNGIIMCSIKRFFATATLIIVSLTTFAQYSFFDPNTKKWGYKNNEGKVIVQPIYDTEFEFKDDFAKVVCNKKYGFVDKNGKEIIPCKYQGISHRWIGNVSYFSEELVVVRLDGKVGVIDKTGKEITPFKYDKAWAFSDGFAVVELNDKFGVIDKNGNEVVPLKYHNIALDLSDGLRGVENMNWKWGFIDKTGKEVIPCKYDGWRDFSDGLAVVGLNGKYGFIDKIGREVIPLKYDYAGSFYGGYATIELNGKWGLIDKTGQEIILPKYDDWEKCDDLIAVALNEKYGIIDKNGKEVIPFKYDNISMGEGGEGEYRCLKGLIKVELNGKWGVIDKSGKEIIPTKYDELWVYDDDDNLISVFLNGKSGLMDKNGEEIIPCKYDDLDYLSNGFWGVKLNEKYTAIDITSGKEIDLPVQPNWHNFYLSYIKSYVKPRIERWQQKDEFESDNDYHIRVNQETRSKLTEQLEKEGRALFLHINKKEKYNFQIQTYDANNQTFLITLENYGNFVFYVPNINDEARNFKTNAQFNLEKSKMDVINNMIGFSQIVMSCNGKDYYSENVPYNPTILKN